MSTVTVTPRVVILHAYSRANRGDGLLVDLTLRQLARVGVPVEECCVVAGDAQSFSDLPAVRQVPNAEHPRSLRAAPRHAGALGSVARWAAAPTTYSDDLVRLLEKAQLVVGVGGGYFRARGARDGSKTLLMHMPQLAAAAATSTPTVYLPQSIGPLNGPVGRLILRGLRRVDHVFVRDDRTRAALGHASSVRRLPDLAVLELAESPPRTTSPNASNEVVIVARHLPRDSSFPERLRELVRRIPTGVLAVQSRGRGNDDPAFYAAAGFGAGHPSLPDALDGAPGAVVIAVRLHAALEAIARGYPAIHLGYERKAWGAYEDLGLTSYVHSAHHFDPQEVAEHAQRLAADPSPFWQAIAERIPDLQTAGNAMRATLGRYAQ